MITFEREFYVSACPEPSITFQGVYSEETLANLQEIIEFFLMDGDLESIVPIGRAPFINNIEVSI